MPKFNDGEIEWDDMIWADEGGIMLLVRQTGNGGIQFRISSGEWHATATIAQFRLDRIAAALRAGIERERALYDSEPI